MIADPVIRLCQNIFDCSSRKVGYGYWANQIDGHYQSPDQVLTEFGKSPKTQALVVIAIPTGLEFIPRQEQHALVSKAGARAEKHHDDRKRHKLRRLVREKS